MVAERLKAVISIFLGTRLVGPKCFLPIALVFLFGWVQVL